MEDFNLKKTKQERPDEKYSWSLEEETYSREYVYCSFVATVYRKVT